MNSFQMCSNLIHSFCFSFSGKIIIGIPQKNNNAILKKMRTLYWNNFIISNAHKVKFSIKDFFSKSDQIRRKPRIWSYLLKKSLMENFIFCAVCSQRMMDFSIIVAKLKLNALMEYFPHPFIRNKLKMKLIWTLMILKNPLAKMY